MNHAFDTKALELSRQAIALFFEPMPGVQLQAKIQNLFIAAMEFAAPAVQEGQPVSQPYTLREWIPCNERLPEADSNYWGWWNESKRQGPVWFIKSDLQAQFQSSEITHWQPLPAAPKQEAE